MARIAIFTTPKGGHRSSSDAIKRAVLALAPSTEVIDIDAMSLMPGYVEGGEAGYVALTTRYRFFWKLFFELTSLFKRCSNFILHKAIFARFKRFVAEHKPDAVLSVHPCFVGSVRLCLKRMKCDIPLYTCIIDLVKHSRLWHDAKCKKTFVPTARMRALLLKKGFSADRLVHSGFPINTWFSVLHKTPKAEVAVPNVLMVSPSLKRNKTVLDFVLTTLARGASLTVVTGSNEGLKGYLEKKLEGKKNVTVLGYVLDMSERLANADVLVAKAGPNMILEAVKMCVPVLITGHILGQEEKNYQYIVKNNFGLNCTSPKKLGAALDALFKDDCTLLKSISKSQASCADTSGAQAVAMHILDDLGAI